MDQAKTDRNLDHRETKSTPPTDEKGFDRVAHGFAPGDRRHSPPSHPPLDEVVRDVVETLSSSAKAEISLIEARAALAGHGAKWASLWGFVAACALLVALLAVAFGAILVLAPYIGPLLATLTVVVALLALAAFASWRARRSAGDIRTALRNDLFKEESET